MKNRTSWQGVLSIVRFNWPFYFSAAVIMVLAILALIVFRETWLMVAAVLILLGSSYFIFISLGVSYWVYDQSNLYRWKWLAKALEGTERKRMIFCHSGFDDASDLLKQETPETEWRVLDHFDPASMTEASIQRARRWFPPAAGTLAMPHDRWSVDGEWADVVFGFLAIHEFRSVEERAAWFREAERCLGARGKIVLVEHQRDLANFLAFGPGFLHFHSARAWRESWKLAGLREAKSFPITLWIRVTVLEKS
ncbi:MAG: hypothetical protein JHC76_13620 [Akkermansiaceae bacterium]|nr:hypothetical protein [Akkermansiaceae bacterium]MBJ7285893.1 hypothetical protein [Akkermansiaceae bacterium]MBJ7397071.1 hypothetical protein [Akkermansiaceae bacterium]